MSFTAKSIILDIADNYGFAWIGLRSIELKLASVLQAITAGDISATYGPEFSSQYEVDFAFITGLSKTGSGVNTSWLEDTSSTNVRIICVFTSTETFDEVVVNNAHESGADTNRGAQNIKITISTDIITDTTYNAAVSNSTVIFDSSIAEHVASDIADDQVLTLIPPTETVVAEPLIATVSLAGTPAISVPVPIFSLNAALSAGTFLGILVPAEPLIAAGSLVAGVKGGPTAEPLIAAGSLAATPAISVPVPVFSVSTVLSAGLPTVFTREFSDIYYIFTLTGAEDSTTDIEIPISNFQTRLRDGDPTFLQVTVTDSDSWLTAINARSNGELRVDMAFKNAGVFVRRDTIASADLEQIDPVVGPLSQSILLSGHKTEEFSSKAITLPLGTAGVRFVDQGVLSYRLAVPEVNLKPGDIVTVGADTFTANIITYFISVDAQYMTVSE